MAARYLTTIALISASLICANGRQSPLSDQRPYALLSSQPSVVTRNADKQPPFPSWLRLKYTHLTDPFTLNVDNTQYPVLELGNLSYWAASYIDNRGSYNILSYTSSGQLWNACEFPGARYLYAIDIDQDASTASFVGQVMQTVEASFAGLQSLCANVAVLNADLQPTPPKGVNYFHLTNPFTLDYDEVHYPVLQIGEISFWALAFNDNRESFAILAYDAAGHLVSQFELPGARYIYQITVANGVATFIGQSLNSVAVPLDTLRKAATANGTLRPPLVKLA